MALYDQHLHSHHSMDCRTEPVANVEAALARGLTGLTFAEHFDTHPDEWEACIYDDEAYSATIHELRENFGSHIFIGKGIEICYQPDRMDFILDFLDRHEFDLVILSVHYFGASPIHRREHWEGVTVEEGTRRYLQHVLEAVAFCRELHTERGRIFDVLGHLDLVKRYTQRFFGRHNIAAHAALIDSILRKCLAADIIPEINTSSLRQDVDEPMPGPLVVQRYAALGGTMMTLGSDAHVAEAVGADLDDAVAMLRHAGITQMPLFRRRERQAVAL